MNKQSITTHLSASVQLQGHILRAKHFFYANGHQFSSLSSEHLISVLMAQDGKPHLPALAAAAL